MMLHKVNGVVTKRQNEVFIFLKLSLSHKQKVKTLEREILQIFFLFILLFSVIT
jgi:hypothetical protein